MVQAAPVTNACCATAAGLNPQVQTTRVQPTYGLRIHALSPQAQGRSKPVEPYLGGRSIWHLIGGTLSFASTSTSVFQP